MARVQDELAFRVRLSVWRDEDEPAVTEERVSEALHLGGVANYGQDQVLVEPLDEG